MFKNSTGDKVFITYNVKYCTYRISTILYSTVCFTDYTLYFTTIFLMSKCNQSICCTCGVENKKVKAS